MSHGTIVPVGDFQVQIDQLNQSASNSRDASDTVSGVDLAGAVDSIDTAMPGSQSARRAPALGTAWTGERDALVRELDSYAEALEAAATSYGSNDDAAAAAFPD
ncbi:MAG: hypothetical protein ACTHW7_00890 [Actinomycetaceae bacterium]